MQFAIEYRAREILHDFSSSLFCPYVPVANAQRSHTAKSLKIQGSPVISKSFSNPHLVFMHRLRYLR